MYFFRFIIISILFNTLLLSYSQSQGLLDNRLDSIQIDSVKLLSTEFANRVLKFCRKNNQELDLNPYLKILLSEQNDKVDTTIIVSILMIKQLENELLLLNEEESGFFIIDSLIVLIPFWKDQAAILFERTEFSRKFYLESRDIIKVSGGISVPQTTYEIFRNRKSKLKIKKLYSFRSPPSKFKLFIHNLLLKH